MPSQDLTFSPLASSRDGGRHWAPGLLPAGLAAAASALAAGPDDRLLALTGAGVQLSGRGGTGWSPLVTTKALAASPAGRSCGLTGLTAVAFGSAGAPLLAGACSHPGVTGIFFLSGSQWRLAGATPPAGFAGRPVTVVQLTATAPGKLTALLAAGPPRAGASASAGAGPAQDLAAAWLGDGQPWTTSAPLPLGGRNTGLHRRRVRRHGRGHPDRRPRRRHPPRHGNRRRGLDSPARPARRRGGPGPGPGTSGQRAHRGPDHGHGLAAQHGRHQLVTGPEADHPGPLRLLRLTGRRPPRPAEPAAARGGPRRCFPDERRGATKERQGARKGRQRPQAARSEPQAQPSTPRTGGRPLDTPQRRQGSVAGPGAGPDGTAPVIPILSITSRKARCQSAR